MKYFIILSATVRQLYNQGSTEKRLTRPLLLTADTSCDGGDNNGVGEEAQGQKQQEEHKKDKRRRRKEKNNKYNKKE